MVLVAKSQKGRKTTWTALSFKDRGFLRCWERRCSRGFGARPRAEDDLHNTTITWPVLGVAATYWSQSHQMQRLLIVLLQALLL
jgi:hypothetical protein